MEVFRAKKFYFREDGFNSADGLIVESFVVNVPNANNTSFSFNSDIKTLLGASVFVESSDAGVDDNIHFTIRQHPTIANTSGHLTLQILTLNEKIEDPTDIAPVSENAGVSGTSTLRVLLFGLIN